MSKSAQGLTKSLLFLLSVLFAINLLLLSALNLDNYLKSNNNEVLGAEVDNDVIKKELEDERLFWKGFLSENPNYVDGWLELAKIELEENNIDLANNYLFKAWEIDPNSEKVTEVRELFLNN